MDNSDVWVVFTKSRAMQGCSIDIGGGEFYYAEAIVPLDGGSMDLEAISKRVQSALAEIKLDLVSVSKLILYLESEWLTDADYLSNLKSLVAQVRLSDIVSFNGFRSEEIETLQTYRHSIMESDFE